MSLVQNHRTTLNAILLSTLFIFPTQSTSSEQPEETNPASTYQPPIHYIKNDSIKMAICNFSEILALGKNFPKNKQNLNEEKKIWIEKAFVNLKEMTDIVHSLKYVDQLVTPNFENDTSSIEGWDPETKSFHKNLPFFQLSSGNYHKRLDLLTLDEKLIPNIMYTLYIKLTKKAVFLERFLQLGEADFFPEKNKTHDRNTVIWTLFKLKYENTKIKEKFQNDVSWILFKNKTPIETFTYDKIKLLYNPTETQKKYTKIKSRQRKVWDTYLKEIDCLKKTPKDKKQSRLLETLDSILTPALTGIDTQDIRDYNNFLSNRNTLLNKCYNLEKPKNNNQEEINKSSISKNPPFQTNVDVLAMGTSLMNNLNGYTLDQKKTWILDACSLLKILDDKINTLLFSPFIDNHKHTYPSWDINSLSFIKNDDFKIAISHIDDTTPTYGTLDSFNEPTINTRIIPILLLQIAKINHAYTFYDKNKKTPNNRLKTDELTDLSELTWEILNLCKENIDLKKISESLITNYVRDSYDYESSIKRDPGSQYPQAILLNKNHSQELSFFNNLITTITESSHKFNDELDKIKLEGTGEHKNNKTIFEKLFLQFMLPTVGNYTVQDLRTAINILNHQNKVFTQLNKTILLTIEEEPLFPKKMTEMTSQERMLHKLKQRQKLQTMEKKVTSSNIDIKEAFSKTNTFVTENPGEPHGDLTTSLYSQNTKKTNKKHSRREDAKEKKIINKKEEIKISQKIDETKKSKSLNNSINIISLNGRNAVIVEGYSPEVSKSPPSKNQLQPKIPLSQSKKQPAQTTKPFSRKEPQRQKYKSQSIQTRQNNPNVISTIPPTPTPKIAGTTGLSWSNVVRNPFFFHSEEHAQITPLTVITPIASPQTSTKTTISKIPTVIQQLNYMLINNPNYQNENSCASDTKIIIPNKGVEKIVIQTGTINIEGKINITLHEKKMQPLTIIEPVVDKEQPELPFKKEPKLIAFLDTEDIYPHPTAKSLPIISTQTASTASVYEIPPLIQQINYILANNPSQNGNLVTQNNKVIIATEGVERISIQTGAINNEGENNISVYVYHR